VHQQRPRPRCLNVFHGRNKSRRSKRVRPVVVLLRGQQLIPSASRQIVKCRRRLRHQHRFNCPVRKFRHLHRNQLHSQVFQLGERRLQILPVVLRACPRRLRPFLHFLPFFLFFWCLRRLLFLRLLCIFFRRLERGLYIAHAQFLPIQIRIPVERRPLHSLVASVFSINRVQ